MDFDGDLDGVVGRLLGPGQILVSGAAGTVQMPLNNGAIASGGSLAAAQAGQTWHFQYWTRDQAPGLAHLSSAISIVLTP